MIRVPECVRKVAMSSELVVTSNGNSSTVEIGWSSDLLTVSSEQTHKYDQSDVVFFDHSDKFQQRADFDHFEFIRTIAVARILMPTSKIRLSAGREQMNEQTQALCFFAGANSVFYGEKLLTTNNPQTQKDQQLFTKLGINTV